LRLPLQPTSNWGFGPLHFVNTSKGKIIIKREVISSYFHGVLYLKKLLYQIYDSKTT
jgi:hypothetical protein